jgi:amino acid adenylation domain-containing protein
VSSRADLGGGTPDRVFSPELTRLAARAKVAAVVTGADDPGDETWHDLLRRVSTAEGRAAGEAAWQAALVLTTIAPARMNAYVATAEHHLGRSPHGRHRDASLLSPAEITLLLDGFAGPEKELPDRRFHQLFEDGVRAHPTAVAAEQGGRTWTYRTLNRRANRVARALLDQGLKPEDVVAVVTGRTLEWLAAVIGVFKAGGCYLPLEPHFPAGRISSVLIRSEARQVLSDGTADHLDRALDGIPGVRVTRLDDSAVAGPELIEDDVDPDLPVAASQLAYIYFTSGSTGEPKGAMCEHDGFLNHVLAKIEDLGIRPGAVVAQTAPQCFDISLWQLLSALLVGGRTLIVEQSAVLDVRAFLEVLSAGGVQIAQLVPSYLDVVLAAARDAPDELPDLSALECVSATGEALKKELVQRWFAVFGQVRLVNAYGLTETSDDTNHEVMHEVPEHRSVPLGRAIRNVNVYVVDQRLALVPLGAPGEIVFSGVCVGRGYVNDPERTDEAYTRDPYRPHRRLYRSGDFGRLLPDGRLEFLGRRDSQVKINGFRIEIGEIENRLLQVPGVRDAAVVVAGSDETSYLVGYYSGATAPDVAVVRAALSDALPAYMVPQHLCSEFELPLTANQKIDRKALVRMADEARDRSATNTSGPPATETEQAVALLWADLLQAPLEQIGRGSRFTDLGGTSLVMIRLAIALDRQVSIAELATTPTVADVAALLDRKRAVPVA